MRLTLQLTAIDNMSRVVSGAAQRSLNSLQQMQAGAQQRANEARSAMFDSGMMAAGGAAALAYPLKMAGNYERLRVSMDALTGSRAAGAEAFNAVVKMAKETPLSLDEVAKNSVMMMGYGQSAKEAARSVKILGDITALTNGDMGNAIVAYGQARQEGKMLTRDLRQFINAGVPIISILKKQLGAQTDIFKMAEEGQISFALLEDALTKATQAGGQFANGMEKLSGTAPGLWMRLTDEVGQFAAIFGQSALPLLKSWGETLIPIIKNTGEFIKENRWLASAVMIAVGAFTAFATIGLILNGAIWISTTAMAGFAATVNWASFQIFKLRFAIFTSNISLAAMTAWLQLARMRVLVFAISTWTGFIPAVIAAATAVQGWSASIVAFSAFVYQIPLVGWILAVVAALIAIGVAIYRNREAIAQFFTETWDWFVNFLPRAYDWGRNLIVTIVDGIKNAAPTLFAALDGAMTFARGFFPSSPAKRGAFRDIQRIQIIEQVAKNIKPNSLAPAMQKATEGGVGAIGPSAAAQLVGGGGGNQVIVTYNPTITIGAGASSEDKDGFMSMLERHKTEMARMIQEATRQQDRKSFNYA